MASFYTSRILLGVVAVGVSACMTPLGTSSSPATETSVAPEYASQRLQGKSLAIVAPRTVVLSDTAGLRRHVLPDAANLDSAFVDFALAQVAPRLLELPAFIEVSGRSLERFPENVMAPEPGTQFSFDGYVPDVVLFIDTISLHRGERLTGGYMTGGMSTPGGQTPGMSVPGGSSRTLVVEGDFLFWDNHEGRFIQRGHALNEGSFSLINRERYATIVGGLVAEMVKNGPMRRTPRGVR